MAPFILGMIRALLGVAGIIGAVDTIVTGAKRFADAVDPPAGQERQLVAYFVDGQLRIVSAPVVAGMKLTGVMTDAQGNPQFIYQNG